MENEKSLLTEPLGLYGWAELECVLLAALATEESMLLVGPHGCAKSFVLERLAESLGLAFRCYNASLINYDDLVGIPMPAPDRTSLEYLSFPTSIWDAEVVFIDELNRTRPELQNKLFPIIHEKRVQGRNLTRLRYRWAAMNPPSTDDDDLDAYDGANYLGAQPLDPALADRFPFVVQVPDWSALSPADKTAVLVDQFRGRHEFPVDVAALIADVKAETARLVPTLLDAMSRYTVELVNLLNEANYRVSTRRATMLLRVAIAVHAARVVLSQRASCSALPDLEDSLHIALRCSMPSTAERKPDYARLTAICSQALKIASMRDDDPMRKLLGISDPVRRLEEAVTMRGEIAAPRLAELTGAGIGAAKAPRRRALALAAYLAFRDTPDMPAAAVELLANEIRPVFTLGSTNRSVSMGEAKIARAVAAVLDDKSARLGDVFEKYRSNLLNSFLPDGFGSTSPAELSDYFTALWRKFAL